MASNTMHSDLIVYIWLAFIVIGAIASVYLVSKK